MNELNKSEGESHGSTALDAVSQENNFMTHQEFIQAGTTVHEGGVEYVGFTQKDWEKLDKEMRTNQAQVSSLQKCNDTLIGENGCLKDEVSSLQSSLKESEKKVKDLEVVLSLFEGGKSPSPQKEVAPRSEPLEELRGFKWLIWSNEHELWWNKNAKGYTTSVESAGRYSLAEALDICQDKCYRRKLHNVGTEIPAEVMVPSPELIAMLQAEGNATPAQQPSNTSKSSTGCPLESKKE